jgi:hypothetical protein
MIKGRLQCDAMLILDIPYKSSNKYKKHLWRGEVTLEIQKGSSNKKAKEVAKCVILLYNILCDSSYCQR